jgi:hypothetical protein
MEKHCFLQISLKPSRWFDSIPTKLTKNYIVIGDSDRNLVVGILNQARWHIVLWFGNGNKSRKGNSSNSNGKMIKVKVLLTITIELVDGRCFQLHVIGSHHLVQDKLKITHICNHQPLNYRQVPKNTLGVCLWNKGSFYLFHCGWIKRKNTNKILWIYVGTRLFKQWIARLFAAKCWDV